MCVRSRRALIPVLFELCDVEARGELARRDVERLLLAGESASPINQHFAKVQSRATLTPAPHHGREPVPGPATRHDGLGPRAATGAAPAATIVLRHAGKRHGMYAPSFRVC